jgi:glutaconate CoA-transferase subunit B
MEWTTKQMMAVAIARQLEDGKTYIIGTGVPLLGATLAKNTHAPNARLIFESGVFEGAPRELPTGVSDLRLTQGASVLWPQYRYFGFQALSVWQHTIDAGFLGGAQIDPYGNLNSTSIGSYAHPETRFTGSGGANGIATYCDTFISMKQEKRRFMNKVDYITSPGWIDGSDGRAKAGLPPDKGPRAIITDMGIFRFGDDKRMYLAEYFPGITAKQVEENTGFPLDTGAAVESAPPEKELLEILTQQIDPYHLMI